MSVFQAIILGIVEGITEFLPISSTFHLIWSAKLLGIAQSESQKLFEVAIQAGAALAVLWLYGKTVFTDKTLLKKVALAFLPTAIVGAVLYKVIKGVFFENGALQLTVFAVVGVLFIIFEKTRRDTTSTSTAADLSTKQVILVGLAQSLAVIPGVSRAGAVLLALLYFNVRRDDAARFSFLLAVPTILAASAFDLYASAQSLQMTSTDFLALIVGSVTAFIVALIVMRWLIRYLAQHSLALFGWYRLIVVASILLVWFIQTKI